MKKILIVSDHCYPEINPRAFRTDELIKEFSRRNYKIDLVIPKGLGEVYEKDNNISIYQYKTIIPKNADENVKYEQQDKRQRMQYLKVFMKNILFKIFINLFIEPEIFNVGNIKKKLSAIDDIEEYKFIISIALPYSSHKAVYESFKHKNIGNAISIADYGDPICIGRKSKKPLFYNYFLQQEKAFLSWFNYISVPISEATEAYSDIKNLSEIVVLPQAVSLKSFEIKKYEPNKKTKFAYAGLFYEEIRYPQKFFAYLCEIEQDFEFHLFTDINQPATKKLLDSWTNKLKGKLFVHSMLPRTECIYELSGFDFLINFQNKFVVQSPSKLIDYAISLRPVLNIAFDGSLDEEKFVENLNGVFQKNQYVDATQYDIKVICSNIEKLRKERKANE